MHIMVSSAHIYKIKVVSQNNKFFRINLLVYIATTTSYIVHLKLNLYQT